MEKGAFLDSLRSTDEGDMNLNIETIMSVVARHGLRLAIFLVVFGLLALFVKAARHSLPTFDTKGRLVMQPSRSVRAFCALLSLAPPLVIALIMFVVPFKDLGEVAQFAGVLCLSIVLGVFVYWLTSRPCVVVGDDDITFVPSLGRIRTYSWDDVVEVTTQHNLYPLVFVMSDNRTHKVSGLFTGGDLLVTVIRKRVAPSRYRKAYQGMGWLMEKHGPRWWDEPGP